MNKPKPATKISRRRFFQSASAGGAAILGAPAILSATSKGDKLRVAFIGTGGINERHINDVESHGDLCTAYADVDSRAWKNIARKADGIEKSGDGARAKIWREARGFSDYREMFEKAHQDFDAVMIGTPDHTHYPATVMAMEYGKHVFTQKPLTHTVWEARQLANATEKYQLATQMGNQGHANEGNRLIAAYVQGGYLGDIQEIHCFTNRPIWPQGMTRPEGSEAPPEWLNWDAWLGCAPLRPFYHGKPGDKNGRGIYLPFNWRGWRDFGGGALADMACHTMDSIFMALDPGYPVSVELTHVDGLTDEAFPTGSTLVWTFPAKGDRPGFKVFWYDGTDNAESPDKDAKRNPILTELAEGETLAPSGNLYIGTKRKLLVSGSYGDSSQIIPRADHEELARELREATGNHRPARVMESSIGHHTEWREAAIGNKPYDFPGSNFNYAGPFTETVQLGNICLAFPGKKLEWDGPNLRFTNCDEANALITKEYREGHDFKLSKL